MLSLAACTPTESPTQQKQEPTDQTSTSAYQVEENISVHPISHATAVLEWDDTIIYSDPTGGASAFSNMPTADIVFVTDIHGDHLNTETLQAVLSGGSVLIVPEAVNDELPEFLNGTRVILANGESTTQKGFTITAIPMYNLPETDDSRHPKGRGNGYILEKDGKRVYFSGDTEDIPEMRALENIDVAFICMNLPYTMDVESAAEGTLAFAPKKVIPYHYRGQDGLSDVEQFKTLVNEENANIEVVLLDWYPEQ